MRCDANFKHWFTTSFLLSARKRCSVSAVWMRWPGRLRSLALVAFSPSMETSDFRETEKSGMKSESGVCRCRDGDHTDYAENLQLRLNCTERQRTTVRLLRDRTTKAALFRVARALTTPQSRLKDTARRFWLRPIYPQALASHVGASQSASVLSNRSLAC